MSAAPPNSWSSLRHRLASNGAILCYHSVFTPPDECRGVANVGIERFHSTLMLLRQFCDVIPVSELLDRFERGRGTRRMIALTFDDAYRSLLDAAATLREFAAPISIFVTTAAAREGRRFWWDRVDDIFPDVPRERWLEFEAESGLPPEYRSEHHLRHGPLRPFRQWILAEYSGRWPASLEPRLAALETEFGRSTTQRAMTFEEIQRLQSLCDVEIGIHTVTHPVLPLLSDEEMRAEIDGSHRELCARFSGVLPVLAIPYGLYDARTLDAARSCGMHTSLTLAGNSLARAPAGGALPRVAITRDYTPWRVLARALGVVDLVRGRADSSAYPALPGPVS